MEINIQELVDLSEDIELNEIELRYFSAEGLLKQIEAVDNLGIIFVMTNDDGFKRIIPIAIDKSELEIIK